MDPEIFVKADSIDQDAYMELAILSENPEVMSALEEGYELSESKGTNKQ